MAHAQQVQPWWLSGFDIAGAGFLLGMAFCLVTAAMIRARYAHQPRHRVRIDADQQRLSDIARR